MLVTLTAAAGLGGVALGAAWFQRAVPVEAEPVRRLSITLGRYDRPWGPERRVFGTVRDYMSSENTARKLRVRGYIARYGACPSAAEGRG